MSDYDYKIKVFLEREIQEMLKPNILEFGVREGRSTKIFLDLCKKKGGKLFSVDVDDYSNLFDDQNWTFLQTRDDNFEFLKEKLPKKFDIIYLDSIHEADHVEKIFYYYYNFLKIGGQFYIDDISWLPYLESNYRDNFYCEINNRETFNEILNIYYYNHQSFDLSFSFESSGLAIIKKKNNNKLNNSKKIKSRQHSFKNIIRKLFYSIKKI